MNSKFIKTSILVVGGLCPTGNEKWYKALIKYKEPEVVIEKPTKNNYPKPRLKKNKNLKK